MRKVTVGCIVSTGDEWQRHHGIMDMIKGWSKVEWIHPKIKDNALTGEVNWGTYDFVPEETIKMHAMKSEHTIGSRTANYYFSYNANIPNQALVLAESLSEANKLIDDYSYGIKYAFIRNQAGEIKFVDCSESPDDELCTPD